MSRLRSLISLFVLLSLGACADPYRNLYEGAQHREGRVDQPIPARPSDKQVPYDEYKHEREKLQKNEG